MSSIKMSKTFIGGAVCQELESEAPAAEENVRPCHMQQRIVLFSDACPKNGDGSGHFCNWRQRVPNCGKKLKKIM